MKSDQRKGNPWALLPLGLFLILFIGSGIMTGDFYSMPVLVAFLFSSIAAFVMNRQQSFHEKVGIFCKGAGQESIMMMVMIFLLAGAFSGVAKAMGGVDATVQLSLSLLPPHLVVVGLFIIAGFISVSMGTSVGTITALTPVGLGVAQATGIDVALVVGAIVGGGMFGDNLSLISDTTIASTRTQNVEMRDKMICNLKIVILPAILCVLLYMLPTFTSEITKTAVLAPDIQAYIKIIPYILLLILGIMGINVMFLLLAGTILNTIIGISFGLFDIWGAFSFIGDGTTSMANTIIVALLAGGLLCMVRYNGGISYIINKTQYLIKNKKSCEFGITFLVGIINLFTANNTVAIITAGPIAKELSIKYGVDPKRTASLLDTTSCCVQGIIPYGAQILIATSLAASISISSFSIMKGLFYPALMGMGLLISLIRNKE